jgi:hypothetical protein
VLNAQVNDKIQQTLSISGVSKPHQACATKAKG